MTAVLRQHRFARPSIHVRTVRCLGGHPRHGVGLDVADDDIDARRFEALVRSGQQTLADGEVLERLGFRCLPEPRELVMVARGFAADLELAREAARAAADAVAGA